MVDYFDANAATNGGVVDGAAGANGVDQTATEEVMDEIS